MQLRKATKTRACLMAFSALATMGAITGTTPPARAQAQQQTYDFNIPAQPLGLAINKLASQAGLQVLYNDSETRDITSTAVAGHMTADEALARVLSGSGYTFQYVRAGVVTLRSIAGAGGDGERVLGAVRVEGAQGSPYFGGAGQAAGVNGVNGSRDITATEGTGSFTSGALTIGSKAPQALKDVPQSISVLTSERLQQQNVREFSDMMKQLPGISLNQGGDQFRFTYYSRGFSISNIQVDGGPPLSGGYYFQLFDMSAYDHVELLRGAAGLFNGYGQPSGTVNLVRKRPLDHAQVIVNGQVSSWQDYRAVADMTSPLALDGKLRGRLVLTYQSNRYFYDVSKNEKKLVYGIAELDVTPTTLLSGGINYARQNSTPFVQGLPRYQDGGDLYLPRSTCLCFPWNKQNFQTTEVFAALEQKLGGEWTAKINLTKVRQDSNRFIGFSTGAVNRTNLLGPHFMTDQTDFTAKQFSGEVTVAGAFRIFGQRQEIVAGVTRAVGDGVLQAHDSASETFFRPYQPYAGGPIYCQDFDSGVCPAGSIASSVPVRAIGFDPNDPLYTRPADTLVGYRVPTNKTIQNGAYLNIKLTAFDRLHFASGVRWSSSSTRSRSQGLCTSIPLTDPGYESCFGRNIGDVYFDSGINKTTFNDFTWPPILNFSFDITKSLTAYLGYSDVYISQSNLFDQNNKPLEPITGANYEFGLKWAGRDGRLNVSAAAFRIRQNGFALPIGTTVDLGNNQSCCYIGNPNQTKQSTGLDTEITGEIVPGVQFAGSLTYSKNEQKGTAYGSGQGRAFTTIAPKILYKLWTTIDFSRFANAGWASGLSVSLGINGQSSAYNAGTVCVNYSGPPNPLTGDQDCASWDAPDMVQYEFTVPAYAVVSSRIDYKISDKWNASLNLNNILDKRYYESVSAFVSDGHWYGSPRSFSLSVRHKW
jgi:outer-membrane receptor for ferric coprogen and ferric-rhodotorulic acid